MADPITIPRHLQVLRETWVPLVTRLEHDLPPALPPLDDMLAVDDVDAYVEWGTRNSDALMSWIKRLEAWTSGPMDAALSNPDIADDDMRRVAQQFGRFAEEMIERRRILRSVAKPTGAHIGASCFDGAYRSLLEQMRDFAARVVTALDPLALALAMDQKGGKRLDLEFQFVPTIDAAMAPYLAWMKRNEAALSASSTMPTPSAPATVTPAPPLPVGTILLVVGLVVLFVVLMGITNFLFAVIVIGVLLFVIRHPWLALLALFLGTN